MTTSLVKRREALCERNDALQIECCGEPSRSQVRKATECCDGNPVIYILDSVLEALPCIDSPTTMVVVYDGKCFTVTTESFLYADIILIPGAIVVTNPEEIVCAEDVGDNTGCNSPDCRICPQDCCYTFVVSGECDPTLDPDPLENLCCNWGADYTMTATVVTTHFLQRYTTCSEAGMPCEKYLESEESWTETQTFYRREKQCNPACATSLNRTCTFVKRRVGYIKNWTDRGYDGFCTSVNYEYIPINEFISNSSCSIPFSFFPGQTLDPFTGDPVTCAGYDATHTDTAGDGSVTTQRYRYIITAYPYQCFSNSYSTITDVEVNSGPSATPNCDNEIMYESHDTVAVSWSIVVNANDCCEGDSTCETYYAGGGGALSLL